MTTAELRTVKDIRPARTLAERMGDIGHVYIPVASDGNDWPLIGLWADTEDDRPSIVLKIDERMGRQNRFIELTPDEALHLAAQLTAMANRVMEGAAS